MKYIRFKNEKAQLHWNREFSRKGQLTMLRGNVYLISEEQLDELKAADAEFEVLSRHDVDTLQANFDLETA